MNKPTQSGWVVRMQSSFCTVEAEDKVVICKLRGRLKQIKVEGDLCTVGDRVAFRVLSDGSGVIEEVFPRKRALIRMAPTPGGYSKQVLFANPDQMLLVFACAEPEPRLRMLDRFIVICEKQEIPLIIVANKTDLVGLERAQEMFAMYPPIGYRVIYTSTKSGIGVEELRASLVGKVTGLAGPSGVGKSSLLNTIQPRLGLLVRDVSEGTNKGMHTTVHRQMFALDGGGYVADMPGLRSLVLWDIEAQELDGYFPELRDLVADCQYNDCTHHNEAGCAVRKAVEQGTVHPERYESYLRLRFGGD
jgi:ribosome biogenesis GTPase